MYTYYYNNRIISQKVFKQNVPNGWENEVKENGEYSYGYYRVIQAEQLYFLGNLLQVTLDNGNVIEMNTFPEEIENNEHDFICQINFAMEFYPSDKIGFERHMYMNGYNVTLTSDN